METVLQLPQRQVQAAGTSLPMRIEPLFAKTEHMALLVRVNALPVVLKLGVLLEGPAWRARLALTPWVKTRTL